MKIGFVGLGKMGLNMSLRLIEKGHEIIGYAKTSGTRAKAEKEGVVTLSSLAEIAAKLKSPRIIWMMVPSGAATDEVLANISPLLEEGDIIIDGGNSYYKDSINRANKLGEKKILFLDAGVSGGIWGRKDGYCIMVGGEKMAYKIAEPLLKTLQAAVDMIIWEKAALAIL